MRSPDQVPHLDENVQNLTRSGSAFLCRSEQQFDDSLQDVFGVEEAGHFFLILLVSQFPGVIRLLLLRTGDSGKGQNHKHKSYDQLHPVNGNRKDDSVVEEVVWKTSVGKVAKERQDFLPFTAAVLVANNVSGKRVG